MGVQLNFSTQNPAFLKQGLLAMPLPLFVSTCQELKADLSGLEPNFNTSSLYMKCSLLLSWARGVYVKKKLN